jgi:hypothetical protein
MELGRPLCQVHAYTNLFNIIHYLLTPPDIVIGSGYLAQFITHKLKTKDPLNKVLLINSSGHPLANNITCEYPTTTDLTTLAKFLSVNSEEILKHFNQLFTIKTQVDIFTDTIKDNYIVKDDLPPIDIINENILLIDNNVVYTDKRKYYGRNIILAEEWNPLALLIYLKVDKLYYNGIEYSRNGFMVQELALPSPITINYINCLGNYTLPVTSDPVRDIIIVASIVL